MIRYEFNDANQLLREVSPEGVTTYRYDGNGNQISKRSGWRPTRYVYDIENRLRLVFGSEGLGFYLYDSLGRRVLRFAIPLRHSKAPYFSMGVGKKRGRGRQTRSHNSATGSDGDSASGSDLAAERGVKRITALLRDGVRFGLPHLRRILATCDRYLLRKLRRRIVLERYFYDGADVVVDYDLFGRVKATYLTPFLDENLSLERYSRFGCMRRHWYTQDGLGSIRQLVSDSGKVFNSYAYTAWGVPLNWHEKVSNRYTYTSREYNPESDDYHYRARNYLPSIGRFSQPDPVGQLALYAYVFNNPIISLDPLGLLQRRQVDYLARKLGLKVHEKQEGGRLIDWPGVDPADWYQVKEAVKAIKKQLKQWFPNAGWAAKEEWTDTDDVALQKMIDDCRSRMKKEPEKAPEKVTIVAGIPGEVWKPIKKLKEAGKYIREAFARLKEAGIGLPAWLDETFVYVWVMKESSWNPHASPYARTASEATGPGEISTGAGLLQVLKSTYEKDLIEKCGDFLKELNLPSEKWDEGKLTEPVNGIVAGILVLVKLKRAGNDPKKALRAYYGDGEDYADRIIKTTKWLRGALKKASGWDKLKPDIFREVDRRVHPPRR